MIFNININRPSGRIEQSTQRKSMKFWQIIVNIIISKLSQVVPKFDPYQEVKYNDVGRFSNDSVI